MSTTHFTLPIPISSPAQPTPGTITCTSPSGSPLIYILTFNGPPDNRMTTSFCQAFLLALDIVEFTLAPGVLVTTSAIPKFYSNGLDFEHAGKTEGFFPNCLYKLWGRLLTYPMPTVALMPGHAFAAGLMTAMYHDYRVFNPSRGFLCLNELEFGAPLKPPMSSIFRQKLPSPHTYRKLVLEAHRFSGAEALSVGLVDKLGAWDECLALIKESKLEIRAKSGVYGVLKTEMWRETLAYTTKEGFETALKVDGAAAERDDERKEEGRKRVQSWKEKAKL